VCCRRSKHGDAAVNMSTFASDVHDDDPDDDDDDDHDDDDDDDDATLLRTQQRSDDVHMGGHRAYSGKRITHRYKHDCDTRTYACVTHAHQQ
jgi:hypothetical protein